MSGQVAGAGPGSAPDGPALAPPQGAARLRDGLDELVHGVGGRDALVARLPGVRARVRRRRRVRATGVAVTVVALTCAAVSVGAHGATPGTGSGGAAAARSESGAASAGPTTRAPMGSSAPAWLEPFGLACGTRVATVASSSSSSAVRVTATAVTTGVLGSAVRVRAELVRGTSAHLGGEVGYLWVRDGRVVAGQRPVVGLAEQTLTRAAPDGGGVATGTYRVESCPATGTAERSTTVPGIPGTGDELVAYVVMGDGDEVALSAPVMVSVSADGDVTS